ncbi:MAG: CRISPR-associated protein Cas5 [Thermoguttaceae bacterium]|jgi:CRISPR-associated protein Cas5d
MTDKQYTIKLEVSGHLAMFARPDTGGTPTSYPLPTWSAAKGLFESIAFLADGAAWICPAKVEVCRPVDQPGGQVCFQRYTTNYGGPLREAGLRNAGIVSGGSSMQFFATVLSNVCYRLHGLVVGPHRPGQINARHFLKNLFDRRLKQGRCFRTPCLGWSEFTCSYWGPFRSTQIRGVTGLPEENRAWKDYCDRWNLPFRDESEVDDRLSLEVPSMLLSVWDEPVTARGRQATYAPRFTQSPPDYTGDERGARIRSGVLTYHVPPEWCGKPKEEANHAQ